MRCPVPALAAGLAVLLGSCAPEQPVSPGTGVTTGSAAGPEDAEFARRLAIPYTGFAGKLESGSSGVLLHLPGASWPGRNLYTNRDLCSARLMDMEGQALARWRGVPCRRWADAALMDGGDLLVVSAGPPPEDPAPRTAHEALVRLRRDGGEVWRTPLPVHHSVEVLPDGTILALAHQERALPEVSRQAPLLDSRITHLGPQGEVLEAWSLYEALAGSPEVLALQPLPPRTKEGRPIIDLLHPNALDWVSGDEVGGLFSPPASSYLLVTLRNQNLVVLLDRDRRTAVWSWDPGEIEGPHDGRWLGEGRVLIFDNGLVRGWSRVVEVDLSTGQIVWEFRAPRPEDFYSATRGGAQRLPNGNTLITNSDHGEAFEVDPEGNVVWRFLNPDGNVEGRRSTIFKLKRYALDPGAG